MSHPIIVVVRHPDHGTSVNVYDGDDVQVINIDLGEGFDITHPNASDVPTIREYIAAWHEELAGIPKSHAAYAEVESIIEEILGECGLERS